MPSAFRRAAPLCVLGAIGCCYFIAQLGLVGTDRFLGYDEAVYYSQVHGGPPAFLSASRARGITWLIAPFTTLGLSLPALRSALAATQALLLVVAFALWLPLLGRAALLGAAVFCASWIPLFYASEISPNLPAALCGLGAVALALRSQHPGDLRAWGAAIWFAVMALIRPTDALWVGAGLGVGVLMADGPRSLKRCLLPALGVAAGWLPWLVEAQLRYGGIAARLRGGVEITEGGHSPLSVFVWHLWGLDGPLHQGRPEGTVPPEGLLWWLALAALAALGLALARHRAVFRPTLTAICVVLAVLFAYVMFTGVARPRYLLPAYAFVALAAGVGMVELRARLAVHRGPGIAVAVVAGLLVLLLGRWHVGVVTRIGAREIGHRQEAVPWGLAVREEAAGRRCAFGAQRKLAQVAVLSGCRSMPLQPDNLDEVWHFLQDRACQGDAVFLLATRKRVERRLLGWTARPLDERRGFFLFVPPPTARWRCPP